ncbi:UsfY protein [Nocardia sp. NPDC051787]|uniref:UsfY protein n=1 Tax=Nocardia sp. NPDC051787 TaxID=3155415 RepID=UPI003439F100
MTADDEPWEIPPLDDAPDIARDPAPQPGAALADTKNWPGYGLLLVAALLAIGAALLAGWGLDRAALAAAVIAAVFLVVGVILVVLERLRGHAQARQNADRNTVRS